MSIKDSWIETNYDCYEVGFAKTILNHHYPEEWAFIKEALHSFKLYESDIRRDGGSKTNIVKRLEIPFKFNGWKEKSFYMEHHLIDEETNHTLSVTKSLSHKIDAVKSKIALEIEWNNKDTFFARDLSELARLHAARVIDVGVIITRSHTLSNLFSTLSDYPGKEGGTKKVSGKFGESTTHTRSLRRLLDNGTGGGCPVLVIGITDSLFESNGFIDTYKKDKKA
ncbi:BglII/BstYI family type II restriction endonuclease [Priestia megaterium]|uniref:BglII/BstYI family type II restriction endonuclease n=1 Tax=Priestia megaterium TaxID=1404 RepID=UPI000BF83257|nr:BglII/BstYI family type II restriction endonuclease [Priestia megaterium]PFJ00301.1 restriction endonuclease [Priestia megaterium]PGR16745.1 restriction endonuclease [Priestia megaterium]